MSKVYPMNKTTEGVKQTRGRPQHKTSAPVIKNIDEGEKLNDETQEELIECEDKITETIKAEYVNLPDVLKEIFDIRHVNTNNAFMAYGFFDVSYNLDNDCNFKKCGENNDIYMINYVIIAIKCNNKRLSLDSFLKISDKYDLIKCPSIKVFLNEEYNKELIKKLTQQKDNRQKQICIASFKLVENEKKDFGKYSLRRIGNVSFLDNNEIINNLKETPINKRIKNHFEHSITKYMDTTPEYINLSNELDIV